MTVQQLLTEDLQPATLDESVGHVLSLALEQGHQTVPVVDEEGQLVASVRLVELVGCTDPEKPIRECRLNSPQFVAGDAHVYDAVEIIVDNELDLLPVVDSSGHYLGCLDPTILLRSAARILGIGEAGSFIQIDVSPRDYTLRRLVHTIEEHGAQVLSINSEKSREGEKDIRVSVRVSVTDTVRIKAVLEHYGYRVVDVDRQQSTAEDIQHRVREFIHYLDV